jgi:hypothetical protein
MRRKLKSKLYKKKVSWLIVAAISLVLCSTAFYGVEHANFLEKSPYAEVNPELTAVSVNNTSQTLELKTTMRNIESLVSFLHPDRNYSSLKISTLNFTDQNGNVSDLAHGSAVINNTTYSYNFIWDARNTTVNGGIYAFMELSNRTFESINTPYSYESWHNYTYLNVTFSSLTNISGNNTITNSSNYLNSSFKSVYFKAFHMHNIRFIPHPIMITTTKKNSDASYFNLSGTGSMQSMNVTFSMSQQSNRAKGYLLISDPNGTDNIIRANITGKAMNGTTLTSFGIALTDGNGSLSANNDPANVSIDPTYYKENFWWGEAVVVVAKTTVPYWGAWVGGFVATVVDGVASWALSSLLAEAGVAAAAAIATLVGIIGGLVVADFLAQMIFHETSNYNYVIYVEGGYTWSWIVGIGQPYAELGFYSDQYVNVWNGQTISTPWEYYPYWNLYWGILAQWEESVHQSPFPPLDSLWIT